MAKVGPNSNPAVIDDGRRDTSEFGWEWSGNLEDDQIKDIC